LEISILTEFTHLSLKYFYFNFHANAPGIATTQNLSVLELHLLRLRVKFLLNKELNAQECDATAVR
jgi:hypothetical protein